MPKQPKPPKYENEIHELAFVDIETTGLSPQNHEVWEIALIRERVEADGSHEIRSEVIYYPWVQRLGDAEPKALEIGGYYERRKSTRAAGWQHGLGSGCNYDSFVGTPAAVAHHMAPRLVGAFMVGCTVHFDAGFLDVFLRQNDQCPMWNYHLIDATTYAAGSLGLRPPWKSKKVAEMYGLALDEKEAHNALADAHLARNLYWAGHDAGRDLTSPQRLLDR